MRTDDQPDLPSRQWPEVAAVEASDNEEDPVKSKAVSTGPTARPTGTTPWPAARKVEVIMAAGKMPVQDLLALSPIWPRRSLSNPAMNAICKDLVAVGKMVVPVVVRSASWDKDKGPGQILDLVSGEHRVHAADREGLTELPVEILVGDRSTAMLWLLRQGADGGTPRGALEVAWQIEDWKTQSQFAGSQRELALELGIGESRVSELLKFAHHLPRDEVRRIAEKETVPLAEVASAPRAFLRRVTRGNEADAVAAFDQAIMRLKDGRKDAWKAGLPVPKAASSGFAARISSMVGALRKLWAAAVGRMMSAAKGLVRTLRSGTSDSRRRGSAERRNSEGRKSSTDFAVRG